VDRPEWLGCATSVLSGYDSPETRAIMRCYTDQTDATTECLATAPCDAEARSMCISSPLACIGPHVEVGLALATQCPDVALLPRLP